MSEPQVVAADLRLRANKSVAFVTSTVHKYAQLGLAKVRANASGRPGPRRVSGDYKRDMNVEHDGPFTSTIGTGAPQGPRLEFGFVGEDSLGRHYDQPPYPHWNPMADWLTPQFASALGDGLIS